MKDSDKIIYSMVRIECEYSGGEKGMGTGFLFRFCVDDINNRFVPVVITNKHVIEKAVKGTLLFTMATEQNQPDDKKHYVMECENFEASWKKHPNPEVDLCAMNIALYLNKAKENNINLFYIPCDISVLVDNDDLADISSLAEIVMVGYPNGIWDKVNNKPIFRKGITATSVHFDFNGKKEFVIDAACFPGSSGSPVYLWNEGGFIDRHDNFVMGKFIKLLGVLYAGPQHTTTGGISIVDIPTRQVPISISRIPNNLGYVIKAERIRELEYFFR